MTAHESAPAAEPAHGTVRRWLDARFRTAPAIYGLIVFAAFISIGSDYASSAWDLLETAGWTIVVFYIAHVFAHTLTDHGERTLRTATWQSMRHASGMLYAALPAAIILVLCGLEDLSASASYGWAMWTTTIELAILGYLAYWRRGARVFARIVGALGTAALGLAIVVLEYAIH